MTTITGNSAIDALSAGQVASAQNGTLDQTAFLKLMTTQLKTQDPFAPVDNAQMVAQMAQFSALAGTSEMNASLKSIAADIASSRVGDAASWIGRQALVKSDAAAPLAKGGYAGEIELPEDATDVSISLVDANGQEVHREELGDQKAGTLNFAWGGGDNVSGALRVIVSGKGADGALKAGVSTWTDISSVQSPASGSTKLVTTLGTITPEEALSLS
jgi:flagellar basal-body rod modification protein FlgD